MAINKTAVFLASRFEEFSELRELIKRKITDWPGKQLSAIDLNDGNVSHRPPLTECLGYVRRAEFMLLLMGDTYGGLAPKSDKSFTHLEYEEAIRDGSNTRVLVFCIGESYWNRRIAYSSDERLAAWQRQVEENHTLGFFNPENSAEEVAQEIFDCLLAALYEMHFGALSVATEDSGDLFDAISDDAAIDDSEINSMEEREAQVRGVSLVDDRAKFSTTLEVMTQPMAVAAFEHRDEAQRAINIGEYGIAIRHLKRALDIKPLDLMANYWLAQLYLALGQKKSCVEAIELAERAAHVAEHDGGKIRAAGAYMIAARAAQLSNQEGGGLQYARMAVALAPHYSRVHVEMARQHVLNRNKEEALKEVEEAFRLYPRSLREVIGDPAFRPLRKSIEQIIQKIKEQVRRDVQQLLAHEESLCKLSGKDFVPVLLDGQFSLSRLYESGRESVRRQHNVVKAIVADAERLSAECSEQSKVDETPKNREAFRFNYPGASRIVAWFKEPGEIIAPEEAVCSFNFTNNASVRNWLWKGRFPIRMSKHCVTEGGIVTPEMPYLFEYVSANVSIKAPSRAQDLIRKVHEAEELIGSTDISKKAAIERVNTEKKEIYSFTRMMRVFAEILVVSIITVLLGMSFFGKSPLIIGLVFFAGLIITSSNSYGMWKESKKLIKLFEEEVIKKEKTIVAISHDIENMHCELSLLKNRCKETQEKACEIFYGFEKACLRKAARLLPFSSPYNCQSDDLIRIKEGQLVELKERMNREIEVVDVLPEWLDSGGGVNNKPLYSLYRVVSIDSTKMLLSRSRAY